MTFLLTSAASLVLGVTWYQWLALLLVLVAWFYWFMTRNYGYWEKKGLHSNNPTFFFGNQKDIILGNEQIIVFHQKLYKSFQGHKYGIHYEGRDPIFYVRDVQLLKQIMIKDFDHWTDQGLCPSEILDIPGNDLGMGFKFGDEWRSLKADWSPAFNLRNTKALVLQVNQNALRVVNHLEQFSDNPGRAVFFNDVAGNFAIDNIAKMIFSIDIDAFHNPECDFINQAKVIMQPWKFMLSLTAPYAAKLFRVSMFNPGSAHFFETLTKKLIQDRERMPTAHVPSDILGVMLKVRRKEIVELENEYGLTSSDKYVATNDDIAKTIFQFFLDGYNTLGLMITMCFYFLAKYPEVHDEAMLEVDHVTNKCNGNLNAEILTEMKYVEAVIMETARIAPFPNSNRTCSKDWMIPGTNVVIPRGMRLMIPIAGIHMDPDYFPDPDHFNPDRFLPENKGQLVSGSFLPFGQGARSCLGQKVAMVEMKTVIYQVLRHYCLDLKNKGPLVFDKEAFSGPEGGCWIKVSKRN